MLAIVLTPTLLPLPLPLLVPLPLPLLYPQCYTNYNS